MANKAAQRVALDSCVVIDILEGNRAKNPWITHLTRDAEAGKVSILTSALAACEVTHIVGQVDAGQEIIAFFRRSDIDDFPLISAWPIMCGRLSDRRQVLNRRMPFILPPRRFTMPGFY